MKKSIEEGGDRTAMALQKDLVMTLEVTLINY